MKVSFIVEGGSGPGNRRSGSLPSLAPLVRLKFHCLSRAQRETWEALNVATAPPLRIAR